MGCKCSKDEEEKGEYQASQTSQDDEKIEKLKEVQYRTSNTNENEENNNINSDFSNNVTTFRNDNGYDKKIIKQNNAKEKKINDIDTSIINDYDESLYKNPKKKKIRKEILNYTSEIVKLFNIARNKPLNFCKYIDYSITLITSNSEGQIVIGNEKTNKIGLRDGISKFNETKRLLLQIESMSELRVDNDLCIEIPDDNKKWLDHLLIKDLIIKKQNELMGNKQKNYKSFGFHFDYGMVDPVISSVLMLVDDNNCENRRRYNILNSEFKYVGISCKLEGKKFIGYFFFAG